MNIFVGNLLFEATESDVENLFKVFGTIASVVIVKEKKGIKSRGFGFVDMPNEEEANNAIASLNAKEFMGRPLNVGPARTKEEKDKQYKKKEKLKQQIKSSALEHVQAGQNSKDTWFAPVFNKKSGYKSGRRTRSYIKKHALSGPEVSEIMKPPRRKENPMRWRKKQPGGPKPWQKSEGEPRFSGKTSSEVRPWKRSESGAKPWKKPEGESRPWKRSESGAKPWKKTSSNQRKFIKKVR